MQAVKLGDVVVHFRDEGPRDAPAVVLINSLGTDFRMWDPVLAADPAFWGARRVIRFDKPGHGLSSFPGPLTIGDLGALVWRLLDHLGVATTDVVGLSVGGLITLAASEARPGGLRRAVFSNTAHKIGSPEIWNPRIATVEAHGMAPLVEPTMERWFSDDFRAGAPTKLELWRAMVGRTLAEGFRAHAVAIRDADYTAAARAFAVPALCIAGDEDSGTPPAVVRSLAETLPNARYEAMAGVGHIPGAEAPGAYSALISAFLAE